MRSIKSLKTLDALSCSRGGIKVWRKAIPYSTEGRGEEVEDTSVWVGASGENSFFVSLILSGAHLLAGAWFYWL